MGRFFFQHDDDDDHAAAAAAAAGGGEDMSLDDPSSIHEEEDEHDEHDEQYEQYETDENDPPNHIHTHRRQSLASSLSSVCSSSSSLLGRALVRFQQKSSSPREGLEDGEILEDIPEDIPEDIDVIPDDEDDEDEEEDEGGHDDHDQYSYQASSPQWQLMTRQGQLSHPPSAAGPAPIHYHIYYTPSESPPSSSSANTFTILAWKTIATVAVLSHIFYWYGGPMNILPPSAFSWWTSISGTTTLSRQNNDMWRDAWKNSLESSMLSSSSSSRDYSPWTRPGETKWNVKDDLQHSLFGQDLVVEQVQDALLNHFNDHESSPNLPLMFYATGGAGVGKRHLAHLLARQCGSAGVDSEDANGALLELDLTASPSSSILTADTIRSTVRNHFVARYPKGSVLLLSHFQDQDQDQDSTSTSSTTTALVLAALNDLFLIPSTRKDENDESSAMSDQSAVMLLPDDLWKTAIVVWTSSLGAPTIDKAIRQHYKDNDGDSLLRLPVPELQSYLLHQWKEQQEHGAISWLLDQAIVLPFVPLQRTAIQDMIRHHLSSLRLEASTSTMDYLLSSLEWQTWIHKPTGTELYTFLLHGGHAVNDWIDQFIRVPTAACLKRDRHHISSSSSSDNDDTTSLWLEWYRDTDTDRPPLRLLSCPISTTATDIENGGNDYLMHCQEICHYPLVGGDAY